MIQHVGAVAPRGPSTLRIIVEGFAELAGAAIDLAGEWLFLVSAIVVAIVFAAWILDRWKL